MKRILAGTLAFMFFATVAQAQPKDSARHHGRKPNHGMMAKELNLTEDQKTKLKSIHEAQRKEMETLRNTPLTEDQRRAKMQELHKKYEAQSQTVFTTEQKQKLETIKSERKAGKGDMKDRKDGKGFGKGDRLNEELNLTEAQKTQMQKLREDGKAKMDAVRNDKALTEDQKKEKMKAFRDEQQEKMKTILTQEQQDKMETLKKEHKGKAKDKSKEKTTK